MVTFVTGLNPGSTTFTAKYLAELYGAYATFGAGTGADFQARRITVLPY
jgi:hypothetical protein